MKKAALLSVCAVLAFSTVALAASAFHPAEGHYKGSAHGGPAVEFYVHAEHVFRFETIRHGHVTEYFLSAPIDHGGFGGRDRHGHHVATGHWTSNRTVEGTIRAGSVRQRFHATLH